MKRLIASLMLLGSVAAPVLAHDEGHGPKLTDQGQQGGVVSPVIDKADAAKGAKASVVYKAELVRFEDGKVSVYLYDQDMTPLDAAKLEKSAKGVVETIRKGKVSTVPFSLTYADGAFTGTAPKPARKPFNVDVTFKEGQRDLLAAFDNLD